jgi:hypothetical protein
MEQRIEVITPRRAKFYLIFLHPNQRELNSRRLKIYADEMASGSWQVSPDNIAFDTQGYLVNGRHRLEAVVKSGVTIKSGVTTDMPEESFPFMDLGQKRNAKQIVRSNGQVPVHADALKVIAGLSNGQFERTQNVAVTTAKLMEIAERYSRYAEELESGSVRGYNAVLRAVVILAIEEGMSLDKVARFPLVLRTWMPETQNDRPIMGWVRYNNGKSKNTGFNTQKSDMFVAQRVVRAVHLDERISKVTVNNKIFYRPKI